MEKIYKEPNKSETETTINVLYSENILSIYTNKVNLQKQLNKLLGAPTKEDKIKRSIAGSRWNILLDDKTKKHLESLGITIDSEIKILECSGGSVIIAVKDGRLALDSNIATKIFVR